MPPDRENAPILAAALAVLVVAGAVTYAYYSGLPAETHPRIVLGDLQLLSTSVHIIGLGHGGLTANFDAAVYNPNGFGATLEAANYSVFANGRLLGRGQISRAYELPARSSFTLAFPVSVGWGSALGTVVNYVMGLGHVAWQVNGTAFVKIGGLVVLAPFDFTAS